MKERLLIYLKRNVPFIWKIIEGINNMLLGLFFGSRLRQVRNRYALKQDFQGLIIKLLTIDDLSDLGNMLNILKTEDYTYFRPHGFDNKALKTVLNSNLYLPFGVFEEGRLVGYGFLRLFFTRTAFFGRIVSPEFQGKGIGHILASFIQQVAVEMKFKAFSTIHKDNIRSLSTHQNNKNIKVVKDLDNGYMLIRFLLPTK